MTKLNKRIQTVKESATLAVKEKAEKLKAEGRKIINLGPGEPDIDTPEHIKEGALKAMKDGKTKYLSVPGLPALREAIANKLKNENGIDGVSGNVIVTNGGKQAIFEALDVLLEPGDEVLVPAPYWVSYPEMIRLASGVPVIVSTDAENGYKVTPSQLESSLTKRSRILILNSPSNPTGAAYTEAEFKALGQVVKKYNLVVISDEVYEKIVYDGFKFTSFVKANPDLAQQTITVNAFSKTYSMTGWRVGYAHGPKEIITAMSRHQGQTTSNVCSIAQYAALAAIEGDHTFLTNLLVSYDRRRNFALDLINKSQFISVAKKPEGAFFLFIRIEPLIGKKWKSTTIDGSQSLATFLLDEAGVALIPGVEFGDDGAVRISYAVSDSDLEDGITSMISSFDKLT